MNIILPIAGGSQDAPQTGYIKTLQEIERKTILQYVFESFQSVRAEHFIAVIKREDAARYHLDDIARLLCPRVRVVVTDGKTQGAACTCMLAVDEVDMDAPLVIAGSDQILLAPMDEILADFTRKDCDGGVVIFDDIHPRWSYVRLDAAGRVIEAAEKRPISRNAVAGIYYYKKARYFFDAAKDMIKKNAGVNGQFFLCPAFNEMILRQQIVETYRIDKAQYYNFSHPSGLEAYKAYLAAQAAKGAL